MSASLEINVKAAIKNKFNVEVLAGVTPDREEVFGVRLRPYGKGAPTGIMYWGVGVTLEEAMDNAVNNARLDRRQALDWAYRPWEGTSGGNRGTDWD